MPFRLRRSAAVLFVAVALVAAFAPAVTTADLALAVFTPVWQYEPPAECVALPQDDARCEEQTASLLQLLPSRAPPSIHLA